MLGGCPELAAADMLRLSRESKAAGHSHHGAAIEQVRYSCLYPDANNGRSWTVTIL